MPSPPIAPTSPSSPKNWRLPGPVRPRIALMPVLLAALVATASPSPAQGPGHRVLPVLYLPSDYDLPTDRISLQIAAVRDAQAWYAQRTGGSTFYADPLIVQRSRYTFAELAGADFQNWWPLPEREFAEYHLPWNDSSRIKLLLLAHGAGAWAGADSENGGILSEMEAGEVRAGALGGLAVVGDSSVGGILAGACPREGRASHRRPEGGTAWWCNWNTYRGTVAHELGHTFGLPHPDAFRSGFRCDSVVITNMQCHWAWPADSLLPFEAKHLRTLPVFGAGALDEWTMARPTDCRRCVAWSQPGDSLLWLSGRGGGTGYLWGLVQSAGSRTTWQSPAGARWLVADVGLPSGVAGRLTYRARCGNAHAGGAIDAGDVPRALVVPVASGCTVELEVDGTARALAIGNPRWSRWGR